MKKKTKICFVIVNRANYGRIRLLLLKLNKSKIFKLQIILCSSTLLDKYGSLDKIIKKDGLKTDFKIFCSVEGENLISMTKTTSILINDLTIVINKLDPNLVVTVGDRFESISTAIVATYLNKYLIHIQGGELSGSIDDSIRHAITKFSNLHLVATKNAKKRIIQMGEDPKNVFNVGCPSIDEIKKIDFSKKVDLLKKPYSGGTGNLIDINKDYIVCLIHPDTKNLNTNKKLIQNTISAIKLTNIQTILLWPNIDGGADIISKTIRSLGQNLKKSEKFNFYKNFTNADYYRLIKNSKCLVGNSSSGIRECSFLGVPVVNIGSRQALRDRSSNVIDVKISKKLIFNAIKSQINKNYKSSKLYGDGKSVDRIMQILKKQKYNIDKKFYKIS